MHLQSGQHPKPIVLHRPVEPTAPSSQRKTGPGELLSAHRGGEGHSLCPHAVQASWGLSLRLLCLEEQATLRESPLRRAVLSEKIETIHRNSRATYGAPRIHAELRAIGIRCSRKRVARLMRRAKLRGCLRGRRIRTTHRTALQQAAAPDLVERNFAAEEQDKLWVADIIYVRSKEGFVYLAFILDACSRKMVGWSMATHLRSELVVDALQMAIARRKPSPRLVHHSDRGVQYTSLSFGKRLEDEGLLPSMGRVGSAYDNALAESFVATLKTELLYRNAWPTRQVVRTAIFEYIEGFYYTRRRHSALVHPQRG
jgi:putative transposase